MISVVVCHRRRSTVERHRRHVARTIGAQHEYVAIDNEDGAYGICAAYNEGIARSVGDPIVFVHDDVYFLESGWGRRLESALAGDPAIGLIGVAGGRLLCREYMHWLIPGEPMSVNRVFHEYGLHRFPRLGGLRRLWVALRKPLPPETLGMEIAAADGVVLAIRRAALEGRRFDAETFDAFHMYDYDICMQVRRTHKAIVMPDLFIKHKRAKGNMRHPGAARRSVSGRGAPDQAVTGRGAAGLDSGTSATPPAANDGRPKGADPRGSLPYYRKLFVAKYSDRLPDACVSPAALREHIATMPHDRHRLWVEMALHQLEAGRPQGAAAASPDDRVRPIALQQGDAVGGPGTPRHSGRKVDVNGRV